MIKNEREYKITKTAIDDFKTSLAQLELKYKSSEQSWGSALHEKAIRTIMEEMEQDVREFEQLRAGKFKSVALNMIDVLPLDLIRARIALGWTQKELAQRLGTSEQQIQKYEQTDYQSASLGRIAEIVGLFRAEQNRTPSR